MSHKIYRTEGLVVSAWHQGEFGLKLLILTKGFGLISVTAQGARRSGSKLRGHIEQFSLSEVSLVYGRGGWRLVGALMLKNYFRAMRSDREKILIIQRVLLLCKRLLAGNEENSVLYQILISGFDEMEILADKTLVPALESLLVLRILHNLGYVGNDSNLNPFVLNASWNEDSLRQADQILHRLVGSINASLRASHL